MPETFEEATDEDTVRQYRSWRSWRPALLMAGCATPQDKQTQSDRDALCEVLDTDKDGKITKEEFMAKTTTKPRDWKFTRNATPVKKAT